MFKNLANKIKSFVFKAQKLNPNSPLAKMQSAMIDEVADQADLIAEVAKKAADDLVESAKKEVNEAVKEVKAKKKPATKTAAKPATGAKKGRPKKTAK
jgi:polyhydroxyalkanoate synthesis regulator phasin